MASVTAKLRASSIVLAAGGTGGHLFPAFALAQELARRAIAVDLITDQRGDRYGAGIGAAQFNGRRDPQKEVTLIAREAIDAANNEFNLTIEHLDTRRNLLTERVPLNNLIGKSFLVGDVMLKGLEQRITFADQRIVETEKLLADADKSVANQAAQPGARAGAASP